MTWPSKTFDFKFFLKIPGCMIEKKLHLGGNEKLDGVSPISPDVSI